MNNGLLLFTLYLSALAFVPCSDDLPVIPQDAPVSVHAHDSEHEHEQDHEDHCTPFCYCSCCSVFVDVPPSLMAFDTPDPLPPPGKTEPRFVPRWKALEFAALSWQPPRA